MLRLTKLSLAHRTVVLLLSLLIIGLGVYSTSALKQELIPSIDVPDMRPTARVGRSVLIARS